MTTAMTAIRTFARTLQLAMTLALVATLSVAAWHIPYPESASRALASPVGSGGPAYATGVLGTWIGRLPQRRPVRIVDAIRGVDRAAPAGSVWAGQYDPVDDAIEVIRDSGDITLAHEYGHALLADLIRAHMGDGAPSMALYQRMSDADRTTDPATIVAWLRGVFDEYASSAADPYGDTYYGDSFAEYFAESFAWTSNRGGMDVPPVMLAYLQGLEAPGPHGR